jgi:DNA gyrase subunit A
MRYTEVRMTKLAHELLADLHKETVDWVPNYDGTEMIPAVMPTRIPNLLVNGSSGIAVGMATNIPPHNLGEVIDGCLALIDNPELTVDELMQYIPVRTSRRPRSSTVAPASSKPTAPVAAAFTCAPAR